MTRMAGWAGGRSRLASTVILGLFLVLAAVPVSRVAAPQAGGPATGTRLGVAVADVSHGLLAAATADARAVGKSSTLDSVELVDAAWSQARALASWGDVGDQQPALGTENTATSRGPPSAR